VRLTTAGDRLGFASSKVCVVSTSPSEDFFEERAVKAFVGSIGGEVADLRGYRAIISADGAEAAERLFGLTGVPVIHSVRHIDHFRSGDVVSINASDGFVRTVYRPDSQHNTLFMTERCNSNCLMCSQPPKDVDDVEYLYSINREVVKLISPATAYITVTGGEPTLLGERLLELLSDLKTRLPSTHVHILTNGRTFASGSFARSLASIAHPRLSLGIPLYSDYAQDHDHIVQARGAFDQTVLGLHQLARWHVSTEIRIVLHKLSIPRLVDLAEYITRNLPFVSHVALVGLEPTG
jgi:His-Xaa-Ser system radical SAM maturase HxsC